jgi:ribonuclease HI
MQPPWCLNKNNIILDLHKWNKNETAASIFLQTFSSIQQKFNDWKFVYTDGSKTCSGIAYSIVDNQGVLIKNELLPHYSSVFTAEALAILTAATILSKSKQRHIICSDSMATLMGVLNVNNRDTYISQIRDLLICNPNKLKLLWVPGHTGIKGNTNADELAKASTNSPLHLANNYNKRDIIKATHSHIQTKIDEAWRDYSNFYKYFNHSRTTTIYPTMNRRLITSYIRFRLGHTIFTHEHIFKRQSRPSCSLCSSGELTIRHLVYECQSVKNIQDQHKLPAIHDVLNTPSEQNISTLNKYIKLLNIKV